MTSPDQAPSAPPTNPANAGMAAITPTLTATKQIRDDFANRGGLAPLNEIVTRLTTSYLAAINPLNPPSPHILEQQLLAGVNGIIKDQNAKASTPGEKHQLLKHLTCWQLAQVMLRMHHIIRIAPNANTDTDTEYDLLAMYQETGPQRGTYTASEDAIRTMARQYNTQVSLKDFAEVMAILREDSPRRHQCMHRDLIATNSGIVFYGDVDTDITIDGNSFHFTAKSVHPFDPQLIFLAKCHIDYVETATNPIITMPDGEQWDVESWINDLSDDEGVPELLWEIIGAIIRPHVRWGKTAWFYSEVGNNGKGTLCVLMRNLCGPSSCTAIPLSDFGKEFALEPLVRATAIIVDENDVGTFVDKAANLKAIVTNDVIQINRKHRMPIAFQFWGCMIQCLNEFPRVKDKSESFYRRQLFVPFNKTFTGRERKYIKDDYLARRDVLEYVLWYTINKAGSQTPGSFYEFSEPVVTRDVLAEYKEVNDPVRAFWEEFRERFVWDLLPFTFLYDLYKSWFADVSPSGSPVSNKQFISDLVQIIRTDDLWACPDKNRKIRPGVAMMPPELLIADFNLAKWLRPGYAGSDRSRRSTGFPLQANYRGIIRRPAGSGSDDSEEPHDSADVDVSD